MNDLDRLYCAATTPFSSDGSVDYESLEENMAWYGTQGLEGVVLCGGTGEFVSMDASERKGVVEHGARRLKPGMSLLVGCAAETTREAVDYARHAEACGAQGLLLIASYYFKPSQEELYDHFRTVAQSVAIPLILYNNPGSCGTNLAPELVARLSQLDNVKHLKEASGDLFHFRAIRQAVPSDFHMMIGCDALAFELARNGARGWISITANALAAQSQALFSALRGEAWDEAWMLYQRYLPLYSLCESPYKAVQTVKYMMDRLGARGGACRLPRQSLTDGEKQKVDALFAALDRA